MSVYKVPPDTKEKEKIIGGVLDIYQFFWILTGLILAAITFSITFSVFGTFISIFLSVIASLFGVPFAFYKKNGLSLFKYLTYKYQHDNKNHYLPNIRTDREYVVKSTITFEKENLEKIREE